MIRCGLAAHILGRASSLPQQAAIWSFQKRAPRSFARAMGFAADANNMAEEPLDFKTPLKVILYPDARLRAKNRMVTVFDMKLEKLAEEMFSVMYKTGGVGLSAPQVGVNLQVVVLNSEGAKGKGAELVLVNPKVIKYAKKCIVQAEGCLSFPEIEAQVERPVSVRVEAQNIKGKSFIFHFKGFQARVFQHEYDHIQSILYFERMTPEVLGTIIPALQKLEKAYHQRYGLQPEKIS